MAPLTIIALLAALYILYILLFALGQRTLVFPRHRIHYAEVLEGPPPDAEVVWVEDGHGGRCETWFLPPLALEEEGPAPLAIVAHGNAEVIDRWPWKMFGLRQRGFAVLLVEFPGYGRSSGKPSQASITAAMVNAYDSAVQRADIDPDRILLVGRSIGSGAACALAAERPSRALMLVSPFTSIRDHAKRRLLVPAFTLDPFDNVAVVKQYRQPVLVVHGRHDRLNPFKHGKILKDAAADGELIEYDARHNDCPPEWKGMWADAEPFLTRAGFLTPPSTDL